MSNQNRPPNFNQINAFDLSQRPAVIPIIPDLTQKEVESAIIDFNTADALNISILNDSLLTKYPFPVHIISLPQNTSSLWLQCVSVQRISDPNGFKPSVTEICLELSRTQDPITGIIYISYSSVIYLSTRGVDNKFYKGSNILIDKRLEHYNEKML